MYIFTKRNILCFILWKYSLGKSLRRATTPLILILVADYYTWHRTVRFHTAVLILYPLNLYFTKSFLRHVVFTAHSCSHNVSTLHIKTWLIFFVMHYRASVESALRVLIHSQNTCPFVHMLHQLCAITKWLSRWPHQRLYSHYSTLKRVKGFYSVSFCPIRRPICATCLCSTTHAPSGFNLCVPAFQPCPSVNSSYGTNFPVTPSLKQAVCCSGMHPPSPWLLYLLLRGAPTYFFFFHSFISCLLVYSPPHLRRGKHVCVLRFARRYCSRNRPVIYGVLQKMAKLHYIVRSPWPNILWNVTNFLSCQ